tara:strand:+ start:143 stop:847 length:705 start_codon:yes stop_codon:yes gene_type:complete
LLILIIGSAPDALDAQIFKRELFESIVAINNAWKIRNDWDYCIFPDDFPENRWPIEKSDQRLIRSEQYVRLQNKYGGFVYSGGTMAFTAGYWALGYFKPKAIAYIGCDMIYDGKDTHFYGRGTPDPLRKDPTLKNLKAKSARLEAIAASQKCSVFNLSKRESSNLVFRRSSLENIINNVTPRRVNKNLLKRAFQQEKKLGYFVEDGKYWEHLIKFDQEKIDFLDALWSRVIELG